MRTLYFCRVVSSFFFFYFPRLISAVAEWMSIPYFYTWCGLNVNLECRCEICCTRLAGNTARKNDQKLPSGHHRTTLSGWIFASKAYVDNRKKIVKLQYLSHMSSQYGERRPTGGWDLLASLGHPRKFQRISRLRSVTSRHYSCGRQPHFVVLNRGRHLYSAGRPSRWVLAHILVSFYKTRHILLSDSANCTVLRAVVLTQYWRVGRTDGRTDRRTEMP